VKRLFVIALAGAALLVPGLRSSVAQEAAQMVTLALPHALVAGDSVWLEIQIGPIGRREISITTLTGEPLGTISPFGIRAGQDAGTYSLPVPSDAIKDDRVSIQLRISQPGGSRAPTAQEVQEITLRIARGP
jgi:hypothetical protein